MTPGIDAKLDHLARLITASSVVERDPNGKVMGMRRLVPEASIPEDIEPLSTDIRQVHEKLDNLAKLVNAPKVVERAPDGGYAGVRVTLPEGSKFLPVASAIESTMERAGALERGITAFHEAGHAVVSTALGHPPLWTFIGKKEHLDALGETKNTRLVNVLQPEKNTAESISQAVAIYVAGYLAEIRFRHAAAGAKIDEAAILDGARGDFRKIALVAQNFKIDAGGNVVNAAWDGWEHRRNELLAKAVPVADRIIETNWPRVEAVATALLKFGKLSAVQIQAAYELADLINAAHGREGLK